MTIQDGVGKSKQFLRNLLLGDVFLVLVILLVGIASFLLGRLSVAGQKEPVRVLQNTPETAISSVQKAPNTASAVSATVPGKGIVPRTEGGEGKYVASKNGTAYYLPTCSGVSRIKEENKIWFDSEEAAENAGYHRAANCK